MGCLKFGWIDAEQKWLINDAENGGVASVLSQCGANPVSRGGRKYWAIGGIRGIDRVRDFLIEFGYEEYRPAAQAANRRPVGAGCAEASYCAASSGAAQNGALPAPRTKTESLAPAVQDGERRCDGAQYAPRPAAGAAPEPKTYTVAEIAKRIRNAVESNFSQSIWLRGEVSDLKIRNGFVFFVLVEEQEDRGKATSAAKDAYQINALIYPQNYRAICQNAPDMPPLKDGVKIRVFGKVGYYEKRNGISFQIESIDPHFAEGEFIKQRDAIYGKLADMGIADLNKRLQLPILPLRIALFSNDGAAGCEDLLNTLKSSGYPYRVTLFSVSLQGRAVESSFREMFAKLEAIGTDRFDIGVIVRGGGSVTDLAYFNNLYIAEWIARSPLKFFIGIGHAKDCTVLDLIGERLITPTKVSEKLNSRLDNLDRWLTQARDLIDQTLRGAYQTEIGALERARLGLLGATSEMRREHELILSDLLRDLDRSVRDRMSSNNYMLGQLAFLLTQGAQSAARRQNDRLIQTADNLRQTVSASCGKREIRLSELCGQLTLAVRSRMQSEHAMIEKMALSAERCDPREVLKKGYALVKKSDGKIVRSATDAEPNDTLQIAFIDGCIDAAVIRAKPANGNQPQLRAPF